MLCGTNNKNGFLCNLHCIEKEHLRRKEERFKLANLAADKNVMQRGKKIPKPPHMDP